MPTVNKILQTKGNDVWSVKPGTHLYDALKLMAEKGIGALLVLEEGEIKIKPGYTPLPIRNYPIPVTFAKINGKLVVDPWLEEEQAMDARLTMTFDKEEKICAIQKGGYGYFTTQQILEAAKIAREKTGELRKILVKD